MNTAKSQLLVCAVFQLQVIQEQHSWTPNMGELFIHLTVHVLAATGLTLRMRLRSHWLLSEWIATVLRPVTLATASHSRSAPSLQSTNTTTGGWYTLDLPHLWPAALCPLSQTLKKPTGEPFPPFNGSPLSLMAQQGFLQMYCFTDSFTRAQGGGSS